MERSEEVQDYLAPADSCGKDGRGQSKMALDSLFVEDIDGGAISQS